MKRAKLYSLDDDGTWNDVGTGWAYVEDNSIVILFGDETSAPFVSKLSNNPDCYQLEGGLLVYLMFRFTLSRYIDCIYG
jgi:hypothetical protein